MNELLAELLALEERMLRRGPDCTVAMLEGMLAPDYIAFGSSGRMFTRATLLSEVGERKVRRVSMTGVMCHRMSADAALLTYRVRVDERRSLRSSLWVRHEGRWQLQFHQGTIAAMQ